MTDDLSDEQRASIAAADAAREAAERELHALRQTRRELVPLWRRIGIGAREDSWGIEVEAALTPRGARP